MNKPKTSFIVTILNEKSSIIDFLKSLFHQTVLPDEIVIVDGGSSDDTIAKVKNSKLKIKSLELKIIIKKGNRSVGRNEAIKNSTGEIIVCSDGGCILDKNLVKNIIEPFNDPNIDVVAGYYKPITNSIFQKCLAAYTCVMSDKIDDNFLPSSRSIAFKKKVWEKVGGYPNELNTCEDLVFAKKLKQKGFKFKVVKNAIVYWPQKNNFLDAAKQFYNYAKGDGEALYIRSQIPFLFVRYAIGISLLGLYFLTKYPFWLFAVTFLFLLYLIWSVWKNYKYVEYTKAFLYLPVLQLTSDWAVILGMTFGFIKRSVRWYNLNQNE